VHTDHASKEIQELGEDESYTLSISTDGAKIDAPTPSVPCTPCKLSCNWSKSPQRLRRSRRDHPRQTAFPLARPDD